MQNGSFVVILDIVHDLAQNFVRVPGIVSNAADADREYLPPVLVGDLGDTDVEPIPDTLHKRAAYLTFPLEAVIVCQMEAELAGAHHHPYRIRSYRVAPYARPRGCPWFWSSAELAV
jgi:hypothetical protein